MGVILHGGEGGNRGVLVLARITSPALPDGFRTNCGPSRTLNGSENGDCYFMNQLAVPSHGAKNLIGRYILIGA
jgi:hypothetical protein